MQPPARSPKWNFVVEPGRAEPLGATCGAQGVDFALFSAHAEKVELCLFDDQGERELARLPLCARTDDVWHGHVRGLRSGQRYGYRVYGPYAPEHGHRFNPHKLLIDPYARALDRAFELRQSQFGYRAGDQAGGLGFDDRDDAPDMPKCVVIDHRTIEPTGGGLRPNVPWRDTVIYELQIRGMTKLRADLPAPLRGSLMGLAAPPVIAHLRALGITAVEIMPIHPIADERHLAPLGLRNYWGYNPIAFFAVEPRYACADGIAELRMLIRVLHEAGIEVILDVVFNHSGEGDELGPTLSFRGIDNASYYRLDPDDRRRYVNHSGCGNTLNVEHPRVRALVVDALRYWAAIGVDGFRFDLAVALARENGLFRPDAAVLTAVARDPVLSGRKLIVEPWDVGTDGHQLGRFRAPFAEWNDRFRDTVRRFWCGDQAQAADLATRLAGSSDVLGDRGPLMGVNYVTCHDGFTLHDLVSYDHKHNLANGEDGADGSDENFSWNCGVEGGTEDRTVRALRLRQKRNLIATLMLSLGVPMIGAGDELGRSQGGNNNAYCQDNETSWIDWRPLGGDDQAFLRFVQRAIALRRAHPALRRQTFLSGASTPPPALKDIVWVRPDGGEMRSEDWSNAQLRSFGCIFDAADASAGPRRYALLVNGAPNAVEFTLPPEQGGPWRGLLDTASEDGSSDVGVPAGAPSTLASRSLILLANDSDAVAERAS
jgi:isoamylase